jgi:hypothetical protein
MTQYFKCTLIDDVILMASLATEGNMTSLDYIPGSNFLGMVANEIYNDGTMNPYEDLHTNKVIFSDATLSIGDQKSYPMPFDFMVNKLDDEISQNIEIYLHHTINDGEIKKNDIRIQLKQLRAGYFTFSGNYQKVKKSFSLKSAYDSEKLKSEDEKMYGMEAIKAGQEFIFSVSSENENTIEKIKSLLTSNPKFLGKSKNAQFGKIEIETIDKQDVIPSFEPNDYVLVYAASNLVFFDKYAQITFLPEANDLGLNSGKINWNKSSIRTGSYSSWNGKRNMPNTERFYISKGSVFYVEGSNSVGDKTQNIVGEYKNEGFGMVFYNPSFLMSRPKDGKIENSEYQSRIKLTEYKNLKDEGKPDDLEMMGSDKLIIELLEKKAIHTKTESEITQKVNNLVPEWTNIMEKVSRTQWNNIRKAAIQSKTMNEFLDKLENNKNGLLEAGFSKKYWDENVKAKFLNEVKSDENKGLKYFAKLASEMSKKAKSN